MANKYMKICSTSLIIGKRKSEMQYHLIPLKRQLQIDNKCVGEIERRGNLHTLLVGLQIGAATMKNSTEVPPKVKNYSTVMIQQLCF